MPWSAFPVHFAESASRPQSGFRLKTGASKSEIETRRPVTNDLAVVRFSEV
jgi:hypothetical protein